MALSYLGISRIAVGRIGNPSYGQFGTLLFCSDEALKLLLLNHRDLGPVL